MIRMSGFAAHCVVNGSAAAGNRELLLWAAADLQRVVGRMVGEEGPDFDLVMVAVPAGHGGRWIESVLPWLGPRIHAGQAPACECDYYRITAGPTRREHRPGCPLAGQVDDSTGSAPLQSQR